MNSASGATSEIRTILPATAEAAEAFFLEFRQHLDHTGRTHSFAAELLMREALNNAVIHGCQGNPGRRIRCFCRINKRRLMIAIHDGGKGFDWRAAAGRRPGSGASSGRGIEILRRYAHRIRYNEQGNRVTIIRRLAINEEHE
jgi:serine/threonine-protein kinase RsbW